MRCIFDSLSLFGQNTRAALLDKLRKEGVGFTSETFDIDRFSRAVEDLLGNSADFVFVKILDEFCTRSNTTSEKLGITGRAYDNLSNAGLLRALFAITK